MKQRYPKTRHFLLFYMGSMDSAKVTGYIEYTTSGGSYLNRELTVKQLQEKLPGIEDIVFTNITELSRRDFAQWNRKTDHEKEQASEPV